MGIPGIFCYLFIAIDLSCHGITEKEWMNRPIIDVFNSNQTNASNFLDANITQKVPADVQLVFLQQLGISSVNITVYYAQNSTNHKLAMKLLLDEYFIQNDGTLLQLVKGLLSKPVAISPLALVENAGKQIFQDFVSTSHSQDMLGNFILVKEISFSSYIFVDKIAGNQLVS